MIANFYYSFSSLYCAFHLTKVSISNSMANQVDLTKAVHSAHGPRKQRSEHSEPWSGLVVEVKVDIKTPP